MSQTSLPRAAPQASLPRNVKILGGASLGNGNLGASGGVGNSSAGTGGYTVEGTGLPQGVSGAPSILVC